MELQTISLNTVRNQAVNIVTFVINGALQRIGVHQTLGEMSETRKFLAKYCLLSTNSIVPPIAITSERFIRQAIESHWHLTCVLKYHLNYLQSSIDEVYKYFYFEAIFSQPTAKYPIPQATASVFFKVAVPMQSLKETRDAILVTFRIEGHFTDHDVRYVRLIPDWILAVIKMKIKLFRRIEEISLF